MVRPVISEAAMFMLMQLLTMQFLVRGPGDSDPKSAQPVYEGKTLDAWTRLLAEGNVQERRAAGRALGNIGREAKSAVPALIKALEDKDREVRDWATRALGCIGSEAQAAVPHLIKTMKSDKSESVRWGAAHALGSIGPAAKEAVPALIEALKGEDAWLCHFAAQALGGIGPDAKKAVPALVEALNDYEYVIQVAAAQALGDIGPAAKEAFVPLLLMWEDKLTEAHLRRVVGQAMKKIDAAAAAKQGIK